MKDKFQFVCVQVFHMSVHESAERPVLHQPALPRLRRKHKPTSKTGERCVETRPGARVKPPHMARIKLHTVYFIYLYSQY
jgi:hypothetical protein